MYKMPLTRPRFLPLIHACRYCGSVVRPMPILDSLQGKNVQMLRCASCEKVSWAEKRYYR